MKKVIVVPVKTVSEANRASHEFWRYRHKRSAEQRGAVGLMLAAAHLKPSEVPSAVHMVRMAPGLLDPLVNLPSSMKAVQDAICEYFQIDDGVRSPVAWSVAQEKGPRGSYYVRLEMTWNP